MDSNRLYGNAIRMVLVVGAAVIGLVVLFAKPLAGATTVVYPEDRQTASAVRAVVDPSTPVLRQLESIPAGFEQFHGYRPAVVDGFPVDPQGSCTSPVQLPRSFDAPCQAHDLGYDLLRYASERGHPLGPWAREALDNAFAARLADACAAESGAEFVVCRAAAAAAARVVEFNSWRQDYGVPSTETPSDLVLSLFTRVGEP